FVGRSPPPAIGGQNMIDPASLGKAVVVGPHTENFAGVMALFRQANAIHEAKDAATAQDALTRLVADASLRHDYGAKALATVERHRGAVHRTASAILATLY
ncbi:MAG: 3-deoxy-D-manno-octulosonic acid transferase, partial [Kiritimatiellaeota bacterium]|nr:3-deoxy-D-manno-octulosonic acid transferase [Kiritimatiellota bacterium]